MTDDTEKLIERLDRLAGDKELLMNTNRMITKLARETADALAAQAQENWQLKQALGYPIPADKETPQNPFKCGTCDAKAAEIERLRAEIRHEKWAENCKMWFSAGRSRRGAGGGGEGG